MAADIKIIFNSTPLLEKQKKRKEVALERSQSFKHNNKDLRLCQIALRLICKGVYLCVYMLGQF